MPLPCHPSYQPPTVTQEVRQVPVPKTKSPVTEPPAVAREFPSGSTSGTRTRVLKRPKTLPMPKNEPPPPSDEQAYPSTLNPSPSQTAGITRPVPKSGGLAASSSAAIAGSGTSAGRNSCQFSFDARSKSFNLIVYRQLHLLYQHRLFRRPLKYRIRCSDEK